MLLGAKVGQAVEAGDPLCWLYTNIADPAVVELAVERVVGAFSLGKAADVADRGGLIKYFVDKEGVYDYTE